MRYKPTVYDGENSGSYESNSADELIRQLESLKADEPKAEEPRKEYIRPLSPYERRRNAVYATGNRWAIENWNATHNQKCLP